MGANVTLIDLSLNRLRELDDIFRRQGPYPGIQFLQYWQGHRACRPRHWRGIDPRAAAPKLITKAMVANMKPGSVIVDVAIDQGGCIETSRPTTHSDPAYTVNDVVHYCVTNMPAAVPNTSTLALTNATLPYVIKLAQMGATAAIKSDDGIREGVNTFKGNVTYAAVAQSQSRSQ